MLIDLNLFFIFYHKVMEIDIEKLRNLFNIKNKVAIVTGAASGIGKGIACAFALNGGKVMATDINKKGLIETVDIIRKNGHDASMFVADITNVDDVKNLYIKTVEIYGNIDVLYIVPGINFRKTVDKYSYEEFEKVINVNLKGPFILLKEIGTKMANNKNGGSIVIMSSIRSVVVEPGQSVYAATKAAIVQLARAFASEVGKYSVRVNAIAPSYIDTPLVNQVKSNPEWYRAIAEKTIFKRWGTIYDVIGVAIFLATEASRFITGSVIFVDGGWTAIDGRFDPPLE